MEETDDAPTGTVRRTRSGAAKTPKASPAATKPVRTRPGPLSRKTRKKVVLMEVEVSDDEDDEKKGGDTSDEKSESSEDKTEKAESKGKDKEVKNSDNEKVEVNGGSAENKDIADTEEVVLNDVVMLEEEPETKIEEKPKSVEKMEVDVSDTNKTDKEVKLTKSEKTEDKVTAPQIEQPTGSVEKKVAEKPTETSVTQNVKKIDTSKESNGLKESKAEEEPQKKKIKLDEESLKKETKIEKSGEKTAATISKDDTNAKTETSQEKKGVTEQSKVEVTSEKSEKQVAPNVVKPATENLKPEKEDVKQPEKEIKPEKEEVKIGQEVKPEKEVAPKKEDVKPEKEQVKPDKEVTSKKDVIPGKEVRPETEVKPEKEVKLVQEGVKPEKEVILAKEEVTLEKEMKVDKQEVKLNKEVKPDEDVKQDKEVKTNKEEVKPGKEVKKDEEAKPDKEEVKPEKDEVKPEKEEPKPDKEEGKPDKEEVKPDKDEDKKPEKSEKASKPADPDAENISEDELPTVQAVKVPEAEEVSDEELPGPKRAELPADTEVVSEDELPSVKSETKKESNKRKLNETDYDPGSPTSENEAPSKKPSLDTSAEKEKEEKPKPKKLPELDKYWKAVNDDPTDFTGWTYLLQYVDQENDMEAAREAYDAFLSHYPYCYGYWRKYADYEKRKGNKKKCEEVFERGLKAIPLSVDLWIHYLTYVKSTRTEEEDFIRSQFERALTACGLEFRSDRLWDSYIKWETEGKRLQKVTAIYDRLLTTPTQGYTAHFDNFQEHVSSNAPNKVIDVDEFLALRKEVRQQLKHDVTTDAPVADSDAPPGDEDQSKVISSDEETKALRERIVSIRRKVHKNTVNAVTSRWNYEEGIKRPYFHVKPLERCQLKNWQDYLDYETEQGEKVRIIVLFERCLIACALYEEFWLKFVHYLENLNDPEFFLKIRDVYERACTIHHLKKPNLHLQWAMFEEGIDNAARAAEILVNLEKSVPNVLQIAYRRINLERRRGDYEKCCQLYSQYVNNSKNKVIASSISIKYSRFCYVAMKDICKAQEILKTAIGKDPNNPRLYLQLIDLTLQKDGVTEKEVMEAMDLFLDKENTDPEQKILFAQRKLEYLEDFGTSIKAVQEAHDQYHKLLKLSKDVLKKKEIKSEPPPPSSKSKEAKTPPVSSQSGSYGNYPPYGNSTNQPSYPPYSGSQPPGPNYYPQYGQQGDQQQQQQYQYQNWQYPQGGYGGYNQWGGYSGGYGY